MAKRFTDTDKWKDPWFRKLKPGEKLVFTYLVDNCDVAGFIELDTEFWAYQIGMNEEKILGAIEGLDRGCIGADNWLWIKNFLKHQKNENLNPENNAHKAIIARINDQRARFIKNEVFKEFLGAYEGLFSPTGKGKGKGNINNKVDSDIQARPKNISEVAEYFRTKLGEADALSESARFWDHFSSNGWKVGGKSPMKDWKSAANNFIRNFKEDRFGTKGKQEGSGPIKLNG